MKKLRLLSLLLMLCLLAVAIPTLAATPATGSGVLNNPLGNGNPDMRIEDVIILVIKYLVGVLGIIALVMVVYGGFQYIYSAGNSERLQKARDTIIYAIIGMVIVILSLSILRFVTSAFK
ncbi:MAG: hypothetical protein WC734_03640 [Patescibacteria group bacterium]|jgi:ABC-type Fe3+ transport system permease subunit